jgi:hypothetical protein
MKAQLLNISTFLNDQNSSGSIHDGLLNILKPYWKDVKSNNSASLDAYLLKNPASSLTNLVTLTLEITASHDITKMFLQADLLFGFELPLQYSQESEQDKKMLNFITRDIKFSVDDNHVDSVSYNIREWGETLLNNEWKTLQYKIIEEAYKAYTMAINNGMSYKEAQAILPFGLSESTIYIQGTLKHWSLFLRKMKQQPLTTEEQDAIDRCYSIIKEAAPFVDKI